MTVDGEDGENAFAVFNFKYRSRGKNDTFNCKHSTDLVHSRAYFDGFAPSLFCHACSSSARSHQARHLRFPQLSIRSRAPAPHGTAQSGLLRLSSFPPQGSLIASTTHGQHGLTAEEIIVMIAGYRGHNKGLAGQSRKSLMMLLKRYEVRITKI